MWSQGDCPVNIINANCRNGKPRSHEFLVIVCLHKEVEQCWNVTKLNCTHCSGWCQVIQRIWGRWPVKLLQSSFVTCHHCLACFWKQTNIKNSRNFQVPYCRNRGKEFVREPFQVLPSGISTKQGPQPKPNSLSHCHAGWSSSHQNCLSLPTMNVPGPAYITAYVTNMHTKKAGPATRK